jgi:carbonic anhydrase
MKGWRVSFIGERNSSNPIQQTVMKNFKIFLVAFCTSGLIISCGQKTDSENTHADSTHTENTAVLTADNVLATLKSGNENFVKEISTRNYSHGESYTYIDQLEHSKDEQHPKAFILSCIDSRVPPEIIFDMGIGELFVDRVAGNVDDQFNLGSMEYAVNVKHVKLVVVLGHTNCGAITAAFGKVDSSYKNLVALIAHVKEDVIPNDTAPYDASAKHNVVKTIENILKNSNSIRAKVESNDVKIVGALYDVATGTVDWETSNW